eukprot:jgi/Chrpa1/26410/Chrysochromulina_OHIO_Genome00008668-RA
MLRFLLVALPLVVASPAAFDAQEVDALQFEVQSPLQFEPSQDKTFSSPTAAGENPGSSYQLHEDKDNNASVAVGQGATRDEPLAVHSDEMIATATFVVTRSDETRSSKLATINGNPGSLYERHKGNLSTACSKQMMTATDGLREGARKAFEIALEVKIVYTDVKYSFPYYQTNANEDNAGDPVEEASNLDGVPVQWVEYFKIALVLLGFGFGVAAMEKGTRAMVGTSISCRLSARRSSAGRFGSAPGFARIIFLAMMVGVTSAQTICTNSCTDASDGDCDDGGLGAEFSSAWVGSSGCVASSVTDPYYETNAWAYTLINVQPAWAAGYTGAGVTINIVDDGPDQTHPDFSGKYDALGSCPTHTTGDHGTTTAAIALAAGNDQCSRGVAYGATLSKCDMQETVTNKFIGNMGRNHISSNSWGIDSCTALASSRRRKLRQRQLQGCPFAATAASGTSPCSAIQCAGASWTSPPSICNTVISTYCENSYNYVADGECASWTHLWTTCAYTYEPWGTNRVLQRGVLEGRSGRGIVYVFSSGNGNTDGNNVNFEIYMHSRFTITVGATDKLGLHSYYSTTGSSLF